MRYKRTEKHKQQMSDTCSENAKNPTITANAAKHKTINDIEHRYCSWCKSWEILSDHYYKRTCSSKHGKKRYGYTCKIEFKPRNAYYSAVDRCKNNHKYYEHVEVKCTLQEWVIWYRKEQARLQLKRPSVDRIDSNGHYEISNMSLIELGANSRKAYYKGQEDLLDKYETLKVKYEKLLKKVGP